MQHNSQAFLLWSAWSIMPFSFFVWCSSSKGCLFVFVHIITNDFQMAFSFCGTIPQLEHCGSAQFESSKGVLWNNLRCAEKWTPEVRAVRCGPRVDSGH